MRHTLVGELRCGGVAVWGSCSVGGLRCGGVMVWGSCGVEESRCGGVAVCSICNDVGETHYVGVTVVTKPEFMVPFRCFSHFLRKSRCKLRLKTIFSSKMSIYFSYNPWVLLEWMDSSNGTYPMTCRVTQLTSHESQKGIEGKNLNEKWAQTSKSKWQSFRVNDFEAMQIIHGDWRNDKLLSNPTPQSPRPSHQFSKNICLVFVSENKLMRASAI